MKKVTAIYFSPTRGTKKYVETVAKVLDADFSSVDLTNPKNRGKDYAFGPDELVIFGAPVYAGRLPLLEEPLYSRIKGNRTPAIFTVVYGNRAYDDALLETKEFCEKQGFIGIGAAAWLAEHTYSEKLAGGRPDEEDLQEAADFASKIKELFETSAMEKLLDNGQQKMLVLEVPGNRPYREAKRLPMMTETTEQCSGCGLCARLCPVGAIQEDGAMTANGERCIGCLRCVKSCPRGGRQAAPAALSAIRSKLEPNFGGTCKKAEYFLTAKNK